MCAYCFAGNSIFVDPGGGESQHYVEDCQVCCHPNRLYVNWDEQTAMYHVDSEPEN